MSFAAYRMMHSPTGIENCDSGFITHSRADFVPRVTSHADDLESDWPPRREIGPVPNLVVTAGNVLEVYVVRVQEDGGKESRSSGEVRRGGIMDGVSGASLELVCHYRLHGNVESMVILSSRGGDGSKKRDSIILVFKEAKISVLEFDDSIHSLRTSSMHCFEGPQWLHLKRGRESFARGPVVKVDPQGRCGGVLVYGLQMIILKASQAGSGLVVDDEACGNVGASSARVESSYLINLRDLDVKHVKDFVFVHGYIEPVMVILHEQELTWAGRVAWKHHTCMISALSISTTLKQHPLIWSANNLPHDAYKLLAVPSPIGGVLVVSANSIHYHSQSASCMLALNNYAVSPDSSQDMPRSNFNVELDAAHATWLLNDVALLSTKTGELLLLALVYDGRVVQRLDLSKSKASVLTSGIASIGSSLFFLGSRLGDSLLVQFSCGVGSSGLASSLKDEVGDIEVDAPTSKRMRRSSSDALQDMVGGDELSLYGVSNNTESAQKNFSFAVRDSLINIGPLKDFSYGLRINADANATGIAKQSNYELVCCSGNGKNGALCILRQSIRPEMITEVELPGCKGIWTVYHKNTRGSSADSSRMLSDDDEYHAYLIISLEARTMVLETGDLLTEVTESVDYFVQGRTIAAGNLFGRRRVIQVYETGARVLDGSFMTQDLNLVVPGNESGNGSEGCTVLSASISDPYVLLTMTDGSIRLLVGDPSSCSVSVSAPAAFGSSKKCVSCCTLYHDKGIEPWLRMTSTDAWLSTGVGETIDGTDGSLQDQGDIYCVACYDSGDLEIFDVPNFTSVFYVDKFVSGKSHLVDFQISDSQKSSERLDGNSQELNNNGRNESSQNMKVTEVAMQRWSGQHSRPFLFGILTDGTILCYHAYLFESSDTASKIDDSVSMENSSSNMSSSRLRNLRFLRVPLDIQGRDDMPNGALSRRLSIFKNISGYQGLFLCGSRPAWFMVFRERLRIHPQLCDGPIVAFTVLHNVNCNHGLIYVTSQGVLKICQLPSTSNYDNYWPVQKVPLKGTPHQVTYFHEKNLYPVIISAPVHKPLNQVLSSMVDQDAGHVENHNLSADELQQTYSVEEFEIRILEPEKSGGPWQTRATIAMHSSENALTIRVVTLLNTTTKENETLLAVGTAYVQGEDVAARGRVLLFSVGKDADNSQTLVSEVYSKELKGAISALASLQGHLLIASGPKIILHKWTGAELNGIAFYDVPPLYVVSLNIVKNFILLGDIHKSIYFLSWKEQGAQLSLLAKDFGSLDCFATEFLIDGSTLSLTVSDDQKNIQIFYYAPKSTESWKGQKLLSRAEFHVGAHVTKFLRLQMLSTTSDRGSSTVSDKTNRFALLFGTLDGSIGCIAPLDELTFRRLQSLQKKLVDAVPHVGGLNPRSFRQFHSNGKVHRSGPDSIVDCELLCHYEMIPLEEQLEIAQQIGTTRSQILSNLNDLSLGTSFL
ncbi:cleavage and polyadenylation specificity factor subunit 1 isoform X1 [Cucurbita pepo subsp. pepo]|uniref:cleavage and polyadenylation specificity factor subunit 1 isoform X1 n=2 Tax=Cucurbita pepo subsp. pepo TaxID=3664 RepID=UPI000C9D57C9|nr:cleavage and polyadenylation specificity factor subunit 1 isoform X1 [Cucurbita pepo subsp. pepo]XP_023520838.1 cleavage and polyadenylation specificity factor subunit 1 isoform X1 [Cucurbita pepo subsp. pepo]XP_023520839.1 cleavage and polyadenylation specificity factor subunit 1 isoform X1 [Cucurbita pepo subsp. pepo]